MSDGFIDITGDLCPMTFVKVKLRLEGMAPGETLRIRLQGEEPLANIPRSLREVGCRVGEPRPDGAAWLLEAVKGE